MKKYLLMLSVVFLAASFSAFTSIKQKNADRLDGLYWYSATTGTAFPNNPQVDPPSGCTAIGTNCALGFTSAQADPVGNASNASETTAFNTGK